MNVANAGEFARVFVPDPDGEDSYPIVTYSWLLLYKTYDNPQKLAALKDYVRWCLTDGQALNESLGLVRLPPQVVSRAVRAVEQPPLRRRSLTPYRTLGAAR